MGRNSYDFCHSSYPLKANRILDKVKEDTSLIGHLSYLVVSHKNADTQVYVSIPFIYEINTLLEWVTTKTVLDMNNWFCIEEIHRILYDAKYGVFLSLGCNEQSEQRESDELYARAEVRPPKEKITNGGLLLIGIIVGYFGIFSVSFFLYSLFSYSHHHLQFWFRIQCNQHRSVSL